MGPALLQQNGDKHIPQVAAGKPGEATEPAVVCRQLRSAQQQGPAATGGACMAAASRAAAGGRAGSLAACACVLPTECGL